MRYVIEFLKRELAYETECRKDAIEYLDGGGVSPMTGSEQATRAAFLTSKQISENRIPQLVKAIETLKDAK